VLTNYKKQK